MGFISLDQLQNNAWPKEAIENRLRAISINAVREARIVFMRDDKPFIDDDARRAEMIYHLLHLVTFDQVNKDAEHYPVVAETQAPRNELIEQVEKLILESEEAPSAS